MPRSNIKTNPFASATRNLSRQAELLKTDPATAARLRSEATTTKPAGNPWLPETRNLSRQAELLKNDPATAARFKAEADAAKRPAKRAGSR